MLILVARNPALISKGLRPSTTTGKDIGLARNPALISKGLRPELLLLVVWFLDS